MRQNAQIDYIATDEGPFSWGVEGRGAAEKAGKTKTFITILFLTRKIAKENISFLREKKKL